MSTDTGGPAFPVPASIIGANGDMFHADAGMTLRDYFAAKAMQALFDSDAGHSPIECDVIAAESYDMADAMLKHRNKP